MKRRIRIAQVVFDLQRPQIKQKNLCHDAEPNLRKIEPREIEFS